MLNVGVMQDVVGIALVAVASLSSVVTLLTGDLWPLLACGVALPLTTALATFASAE